jgi:hypothetical protein
MAIYKVIRDSKEKQGHGWTFGKATWCEGTEVKNLTTGDYTLEGLEDNFTIERKADTSELSLNINEARFVRELERLDDMEYPFVVCECTYDDLINFPHGSGIPRHLWEHLKVSNHYLIKKIVEFQLKYKAKWIFAGQHGQRIAASILKRMAELQDERATKTSRKSRCNKKQS